MIKVLIVDDEFRVCQLICNLIDWGSLDMQIIGVAHNGIEARELARETVPDLVITDIRMPGCTGLELVEQLREIYRSVSFIIISGYTNFEYTRLAIQYGVSDYLLKPIDKEELLATVTRIRHEIEARRREQAATDRMRRSFFNDQLGPGLLFDGCQEPEEPVDDYGSDQSRIPVCVQAGGISRVPGQDGL